MTTADFYGSQLPAQEPKKKDIQLGFAKQGGDYYFHLIIDQEEYELILDNDDVLNLYQLLIDSDPVKQAKGIQLNRTIEQTDVGNNYE